MDTSSRAGLNCFSEKRWRKQRKKNCKSNLYDQNTVLLSSCQIRSWICFWWLAQTYIFPLARKKVSFRVGFFYFISLEGKTQQQQCGLELQLMNSISVAPKIAGEVNETTNSMGLIPFWMQLFWARGKLPYCLPKWYSSNLLLSNACREKKKTQPNNHKTPPNPDQENQEPLKACSSISKPVSVCPQCSDTRKKEAFLGQFLLSFALAEMMPLKLRELLAGWLAQWTSGRIQVSLTWSEQRSLSQPLRHTNWLFNHIEQNRLPFHFSPSSDLIRDIK